MLPSNAPSSAAAAAGSSTDGSAAGGGSNNNSAEEDLRKKLRLLTQEMKKREPLKTTYKHLLTDGVVTSRKPSLPKDKFYRRISSRLRETVEAYMVEMQGKDPFDRIAQRQPLEEEKMRAALTLREFKEHEQKPLLEATLAAMPKRQGMDEMTRRRHLDGVALGLQSPTKKPRKMAPFLRKAAAVAAVDQETEQARQAAAALDKKRQEARLREEALQQAEQRKRQEEEEEKRREQENARSKKQQPMETPQQALHKYYQPIFKLLWDMEFPYLGNTNPFRTVIDRENCAAVGAPDYFDVITTPMNLTYIHEKVDAYGYSQLSDFFKDVDLMLQNALTYNSDPSNPYRIAAEEMQKKYKRAAKRTVQTIQKKLQANKAS